MAKAEALLADDYLGVDPRGEVSDKKAVLAEISRSPHARGDEVGPVTVRFYGDTAIAQAREHQVGPPPELKPGWTVFTDTWVKIDGRWRIVASEDLDPGAPTAAAFTQDQAAIRALRARSNKGIAEHDMVGFTPIFADDAVFVWSDGTSAVGKAELVRRFRGEFDNPNVITFVRTPETVAVSDQGVRAVEHGTWTGLRRDAHGDTRYGGDYMAHWFKTVEGWRVRGEVYVKLRCDGPLCSP